jgi:parallel beta-helix repeat protein
MWRSFVKSLVNILAATAVLLALSTAACATDVFGDVWGEWNLAGSPYYVMGDVSVPQDSTLIINAGVEVLFWGYYKFSVQANATLQAWGGPGLDSVRFSTPFTSTGWHGLRFFAASPACSLAYCVFEYGKATSGGGENLKGGAIYCSGTDVKISHSWIRTCTASSQGGGIYIGGYSEPTISDSTKISGNSTGAEGGGICSHTSNPTISGSTISSNSSIGGGGGIYCHNSAPTISGNTISSNSANGGGSGIFCFGSVPAISGNTISGNSASNGGGGGIMSASSDPSISGNTLSGNSATVGGGMYIGVYSNNATISGNTISGNSAITTGGGIYCGEYANVSINNCLISGNSASSGAGIYSYNTSPTLSHCTIAENIATNSNGGGIGCLNSGMDIINCTISGNQAGGAGMGGGIACNNSTLSLVNTILSGNAGPGGINFQNSINTSVTFSDFYDNEGGNFTGSPPPGLGWLSTTNANGDSCDLFYNILEDPLFVNAGGGDFHLLAGSPCIDAGDPTSPLDPDSTIADIGAFYFNQEPQLPQSDIEFSTTSLDFGEVPTGMQDNLPLVIYNVGDTTLVIYSITSSDPDFTTNYQAQDSLIAPDDSLVLEVSFGPTQAASYSETLTILNNDEAATVALQGVGVGPINISMTPSSPPIIVPVGGGTFNFNIAVQNLTTAPQTFDLWTVIHLPGVGEVPVLTMNNLALPAGSSQNRDRTQIVPAQAPAGTYEYFGYVGDYPWVVQDYDSFTFSKAGTDRGILGSPADWPCTGEPFTSTDLAVAPLPEEHALHQAFPNPFNPSTIIKFDLPEAALAKMSIYDLSGRLAATLVNGWREAGAHEVTFDASSLPSGIYFCRLEAGEFTASQKLILLK